MGVVTLTLKKDLPVMILKTLRELPQDLEQLDLRSFYDINVLWFMTPDYMARHAEEVPRQIDRIVDAAAARAIAPDAAGLPGEPSPW